MLVYITVLNIFTLLSEVDGLFSHKKLILQEMLNRNEKCIY